MKWFGHSFDVTYVCTTVQLWFVVGGVVYSGLELRPRNLKGRGIAPQVVLIQSSPNFLIQYPG